MPRRPLAASPRLLVVEDQEDIRTLLMTVLEIEGYEVVGARDARDGLRCLDDLVVSLIITDYAMPGGNGIWMLHEAARRGLLDGTPALVVTAHPDLREGGYPVMQKPLDLDRFLQQVRQLLGPPEGGDARVWHASDQEDGTVELVLYVSSSSLASRQARHNLAKCLRGFDPSRIRVTIRDVSRDPLVAEADLIVATPTLVKTKPAPRICIVGNLRDSQVLLDVLEGAGIEPAGLDAAT